MTTDGDTASKRQADERVRPRTPGQPSALPDWMRDPPPPGRTLGVRLADAVAALPGAGRIRRRWWIWQQRERLAERYPNAVKIMAVVLSFVVILLLVLSAHALYGLA
ncbi:hypothetical protein [Micromonospora sp. LOL_024]|uniref:hypothetical protein n=1 Tax=Micromonospora sp. LOL_024 TaxID=3345412 RepID=UPI003A8901AF